MSCTLNQRGTGAFRQPYVLKDLALGPSACNEMLEFELLFLPACLELPVAGRHNLFFFVSEAFIHPFTQPCVGPRPLFDPCAFIIHMDRYLHCHHQS